MVFPPLPRALPYLALVHAQLADVRLRMSSESAARQTYCEHAGYCNVLACPPQHSAQRSDDQGHQFGGWR